MEAYSNYHEAQLGERKVDDEINVSPDVKATDFCPITDGIACP